MRFTWKEFKSNEMICVKFKNTGEFKQFLEKSEKNNIEIYSKDELESFEPGDSLFYSSYDRALLLTNDRILNGLYKGKDKVFNYSDIKGEI